MSTGAEKVTPTSQFVNIADGLYAKATSTIRWLDMPEGKAFLEFISKWIELEEIGLKHTGDLYAMLRLQGSILSLERIKNLRNELLKVQKSGKPV